jgi:hypothetical protein
MIRARKLDVGLVIGSVSISIDWSGGIWGTAGALPCGDVNALR